MAEAVAVAAPRVPGGAWSRALPRMRRHRGAVVGIAVVAALAVVAVAQNVVAPQNPIRIDIVSALRAPDRAH